MYNRTGSAPRPKKGDTMRSYTTDEYEALPSGREKLEWAWEAYVELSGVTCEQQDAMTDDEWAAFDDERRFWEGEVRHLDKLVA